MTLEVDADQSVAEAVINQGRTVENVSFASIVVSMGF